jgi:integrase
MALYKRENSKYWWMKFTFDGQVIRQSCQVANRRDALTVESAFRTQLALGKIGIKPKEKAPTFREAAADFLKVAKLEHLQKPRSFVRIEYCCKSLVRFFGDIKVDRIERKDVEKFIQWRSNQTSKKTGKPITGDSVNGELIVLKTIFKRLVSANVITHSPARDIKQLSKNERNFHVLTDDEEKIYLLAAPQPLQDVAALMLQTGMRPSEIYTLNRQSVNIEKGFIQLAGGKTKSSNRKVWLSSRAKELLQFRLDKFKGNYLFPKGETDSAGPTYELNDTHSETLKRNGLKFRIYDCRHTFATRVLESGIDLVTLASMLGHSNLNEVMRYAHPSETRKKEAADQMQKRITKAV